MKKVIFGALVAMVLAACVKEDVSIAKIEEVKNPYAVTPDEAVQLLKSVMGGESTRAVSVGEIKTLRKSDFVPTTRGGEDGDVIYIVDLENGGSAVMGADKRMEPIYAILDETKISAEKLTLTATRTDDGEQDIEEYVMGLMNNKISNDISLMAAGGGLIDPGIPIIPRDQTWTETTVLGRRDPLLMTKWSQDYPFNYYFPILDNHVFNREYAGCVTVALAQIFCYNRFPNHILTNYINWDNVCQHNYTNSNPSNAVNDAVAWLMWSIALDLPADWGDTDSREDGTASSIEDAAALMSRLGYSNVQILNGTNRSSVINMLCNRQQPVYIRGESNVESNHDIHAWVLDGCNIYKNDYWVRHYENEFVYNEYIESTIEHNLVHCNFGYLGRADGWYTLGAFNLYPYLDDEYIDESIGDLPAGYVHNENYTYGFRIITFEH